MSRSPITKAVTAHSLAVLIILSLTTQAILPLAVHAQTPTDESTAEIQTGDAVAGLEVQNEANTTEINTPVTEPSESNAIPEEDTVLLDLLPVDQPAESTTLASTTNLATTTTDATSAAQTGENSASGETASVTTGDAIAYVDLLNVVNTNIINSDGLVSFINDALGYDTFDLRPDFDLVYAGFDTAASTSSCEPGICASDPLLLYSSSNTAVIDNSVTVIADTGLNTADGDTAQIETGNAYASANIINVANTNIVDSQYLLLIFNNFSDYAGDIVLPSSNFFDQFLTNNAIIPGNVTTTNDAVVENNIETVAYTGDNIASGDDTSIETGSAVASSDVTNLINQNFIGGSTFSMLIRVHGDWTGTISGLPEGMTWRETERGIEIISTTDTPGLPIKTSDIDITNSASIQNNVHVYALTGDNEVNGESTSIKTGDAYAGSSIMNIANTNIIGSNWSNLIFNIYGNWSGNLTFGQPDLWLGVTASTPATPVMPGGLVTYTFTVFNHGDTTAPNVTLDGLFENDTLSFSEGERSTFGNDHTKQRWSLGDIKSGETKEFTHVAKMSDKIDRNAVSAIPLTSRVTSSQRDANNSDNEEVVTVYVGKKRSGGNSQQMTFPANLDITKTASHDLAQPGDTVDYTITFFNRGGPLFDALLVDVLEDEAGNIVQQHSWPLTEIKTWETITVSYSMEFDSGIASGTYTNYAQLVGLHGSRREKNQRPYESSIASHILGLGTTPESRVLGIQDSTCSAYLTTYLRYGTNNDQGEVQKLQTFLNNQLERQLVVSGYFDLTTEQAVRDFQLLHRDEILTPWGLERDSGYVYYTTQQKINEIMCQNNKTFALNKLQQTEIDTYRNRLTNVVSLSFLPSSPPDRSLPEPFVISPITITSPTSKESINLKEGQNEILNEVLSETPKIETSNLWSGVKQWWQSITIDTLSFWRR